MTNALESFSLRCAPIEAGWCDTTIRLGDRVTVERSFSDLGVHPARALLTAVDALTDPGRETRHDHPPIRVVLDDEDRGIEILIGVRSDAVLHIVLSDALQSFGDDGTATRTVHGEADVPRSMFADAVHEAAACTLACHGIIGYEEAWGEVARRVNHADLDDSLWSLFVRLTARRAGVEFDFSPEDTLSWEARCMRDLTTLRSTLGRPEDGGHAADHTTRRA